MPGCRAAHLADLSLLRLVGQRLGPVEGQPLQELAVRDPTLEAVADLGSEVEVIPQTAPLKGTSSPELQTRWQAKKSWPISPDAHSSLV